MDFYMDFLEYGLFYGFSENFTHFSVIFVHFQYKLVLCRDLQSQGKINTLTFSFSHSATLSLTAY